MNPGASEVCDALDADEDCDGLVDDADSGVTGQTTWYADLDRDGYGAGAGTLACDPASPIDSPTNDDCDDGRALVHPGASELPNGADDDCDGSVDGDDADCPFVVAN